MILAKEKLLKLNLMFKYILVTTHLVTFVFFIQVQVLGQNTEEILQIQQLDSSSFFFLKVQNGDYLLSLEEGANHDVKRTYNLDTLHTICSIKTVKHNEMIFKSGIHIQFLSELVGFVYGNYGIYQITPFMLKTVDGGLSWKRVLFTGNDQQQITFRKSDFFMFNDLKGIAIINNDKGFLSYALTSDGGETWQRKSYKLNNKWISDSNLVSNVFCSDDGIVTIVISQMESNKNDSYRVMVIRSNNFGAKFRTMK